MSDILKQLKHLVKFRNLTRNSDSWFACDSELFFSVVDLPKISGGMLSSGVTNHWKPHRFIGKHSGSWQVFSPYKSFGRKVFGYPHNFIPLHHEMNIGSTLTWTGWDIKWLAFFSISPLSSREIFLKSGPHHGRASYLYALIPRPKVPFIMCIEKATFFPLR